MRIPWIQVADEAWEKAAMLSGILPRVDEDKALAMLCRLWRWALTLGPDDQPPSGVLRHPLARKMLAGALRWKRSADELVEALHAVDAIEVTPDLIRVRGLKRYAATWRKNRGRPDADGDEPTPVPTPAASGPNGTRTEPERNPNGTGPVPTRKTETEKKTEKQPPPSVVTATDAPSTPAFALHPTKPERLPRQRSPAEACFDRCEDLRLALSIGGPRRHLQGNQVARWNRFYRDRILELGGDEERFMAVAAAYLTDGWGLSLDPPCAWSGLTSAEAWERCRARSERVGTGPPETRAPRDAAEAKWFRVLGLLREAGQAYAVECLTEKTRLRARLDGESLVLTGPEKETIPWVRETYGQLLADVARQLNIMLLLEDQHADTAHSKPDSEDGQPPTQRASG